jgi:hypothetical protein
VMVDDCSGFGCYEQAFGNLAYRRGPARAVVVLSRMLRENVPAVRGGCHTIAHWIGSATLSRYRGDAAKAMAHGSMICGSGFYHGIVMFALRTTQTRAQLVAKVRDMCSEHSVQKTTFLRYQCVHGLGHGLMIFSGDNLPWSLRMCDVLRGSWSQQSCSGGVFMQNFDLPSRMAPIQSRFVRKRDLLYPCDWVRARYKYYCYLQVTEHVLNATHYDWKRTASTCAKAPAPWDSVCFQSYGRDASGASRYRPVVAYNYCGLSGSHLADCIYGVARDFVNNDVRGDRAATFCRLSPPRLRGFCFYAIGTILSTFGTRERMRQNCNKLAGSFARECNGRLSARERKLLIVP